MATSHHHRPSAVSNSAWMAPTAAAAAVAASSSIAAASPSSSSSIRSVENMAASHVEQLVAGSQRKPGSFTCHNLNGNAMDAGNGCGGGGGGGGAGGHQHQQHLHQHQQHHVKQCAACGQNIFDRYLLHTMDRFWHMRCLKCTCCQVALAEIGTSCFSRAGMTLCKADYIRLFGSTGTCCACRMTIPANEFVMKAQGSVYHVTCFACTTCHNRLVPGDRYGMVNGSIVCENDYCKMLKAQSTTSSSTSATTLSNLRSNHKVCD